MEHRLDNHLDREPEITYEDWRWSLLTLARIIPHLRYDGEWRWEPNGDPEIIAVVPWFLPDPNAPVAQAERA